jgi:hypothetical protein
MMILKATKLNFIRNGGPEDYKIWLLLEMMDLKTTKLNFIRNDGPEDYKIEFY